MLGKDLQLKTTALLSLFSMVSKVLEKLVNNRIVDHLEKCGLFYDLPMLDEIESKTVHNEEGD